MRATRRRIGSCWRILTLQYRIMLSRTVRLSGARRDWSHYPGLGDVAELQLFTEIEVVPGQSTYGGGDYAIGGPIWPDYADQTAARFNRLGRAIDPAPVSMGYNGRMVNQPCLWGGFAFSHFGHLSAEIVGRVLISVRQRPNDIVLFMVLPDQKPWHLPGYFWSILQWCGLEVDRVRILTKPLSCRELRVAPQPEQLDFGTPSPAYLNLLAENAERNELIPIPHRLLYVTRVGVFDLGKGCHAAESYLVELLSKIGATILYPEKTSLRHQLALYAGAKTIVFAEGSALHGRQLLGWIDQQIVVINRRMNTKIGGNALAARCAALRYVEATHIQIAAVAANEQDVPASGLSIYDVERVLSGLLEAGIDLSPHWDQDAYRKAVAVDVSRWIILMRERPDVFHLAKTIDRARQAFGAVGMHDMLPLLQL